MNLGDMFVTVGTNLSGFSAGMREVKSTLNSTASELKTIGAGMTAAITLPLVGAGLAALKVAGDLEQTGIAFKTMMGSSIAATAHLKELKDFAMKTPFQFSDLTLASKRMQALGFEAKSVIPILTNVGDAASALGMGAEGIQRIVTALGQMKAKGMVQAEEMRQLAEAGIPAWQILAKVLNTDVAGAMKAVEARTVSAGVAIPAILAGMNEKFGGLMKAQAETLLGQWSNIKDKIYFALGDIGATLAPVAKNMMANVFEPMLKQLGGLAKAFSELSPATQQWAIAAAGAAAAIGPLAIVLGTLISAFQKIGPLLTGLPMLLNPVALGIMAVATAAGILYYEFGRATKATQEMDTAFSKFITKQVTEGKDFVKIHEMLNEARANGTLKAGEYAQMLEILADREKKAMGAEMKAAVSDFGITVTMVTDKAAVSTKELAKQTKEAAKEAKAMAAEFRAIPWAEKSVEAEVMVEKLNAAVAAHKKIVKEVADSGKTVEQFFSDLFTNAARSVETFLATAEPMANWADGVEKANEGVVKGLREIGILLPGIPPEIAKINAAASALGVNLEKGNIPDLTAKYDDLKDAYDRNAISIATLNQAYVNLIKAKSAAGEATEAEIAAAKKLEEESTRGMKKVAKDRYDLGRELEQMSHRTFDALERDIARNIVAWKGWKDSIKNIGKGLAEDFLSIMMKALFKPLEDQFAKIASKLGTLLGGGSSAAGTATTAAGGAVSTGASAAGTAGTVVGAGLTGIVSAVSGVVSAVSGVIGNFQMAGMNKSLDLIVNHTLRMFNEIYQQRIDHWDQFNGTFTRLGEIWNTLKAGGGTGGGFTFTNCTFGAGTSKDQIQAWFREAVAARG